MSQLLRQKISRLRTRRICITLGTGLAMAIASFVGILILTAVADWLLKIPREGRTLLLAANSALALYCFLRHGLLPILRGADDESLALAVERLIPEFSSRLIAAIQFSRPDSLTTGESGALVQAMVAQTEQIAERVSFRPVIKSDRFIQWSLAAIVSLFAASGLYAYGGPTAPILLRRAFLEQVSLPAKTDVEVLSGSFLVAEGERSTLQARAIGYQPDSGYAEILYDSGRKLTLPLQRSTDTPDLYAGAIESTQESFSYHIRLYDGESDSFRVTAEPRPAVLSLSCTQIYPAYTGLPETPRQPTDLLLLAGSKLRLILQTNKPLAPNDGRAGAVANFVQLANHEGTPAITPVPLQADPSQPLRFTATLNLPENLSGFSIQLVDKFGLKSKNPPFYVVDLLPDRPPDIRITSPDRREMLVTSEATCTVGFVAEDDYGMASVSLHYKIDEEPEKTIPLSITIGDRRIRGYYPWPVGKLPPPADKPSLEGCVIEFFVEARDANDFKGPGITTSEHYQLRVVSKADKQAELIARMAESFTTIHDVSEKQENAAGELGALITEQPSFTQPKR